MKCNIENQGMTYSTGNISSYLLLWKGLTNREGKEDFTLLGMIGGRLKGCSLLTVGLHLVCEGSKVIQAFLIIQPAVEVVWGFDGNWNEVYFLPDGQ